MVNLVPMTPSEFDAYCGYSIAQYASEHVRSGRWTPEEAYEQAAKQFKELLPDGVASKDNYLYTLRDPASQQNVGILWFAVEEQAGKRSAFVYDIEINPEFRRHGYGRQAFHELEQQARELGLDSIRLHVFGHNHAARALYEQLGFVPTNIAMVKSLAPAE